MSSGGSSDGRVSYINKRSILSYIYFPICVCVCVCACVLHITWFRGRYILYNLPNNGICKRYCPRTIGLRVISLQNPKLVGLYIAY